jgi:hypothetical protein
MKRVRRTEDSSDAEAEFRGRLQARAERRSVPFGYREPGGDEYKRRRVCDIEAEADILRRIGQQKESREAVSIRCHTIIDNPRRYEAE